MKCPKCGYLGFETTDRCRNCGYDFSLAAPAPAVELPLRAATADAPLADLELREEATPAAAEPADPLHERAAAGFGRGEPKRATPAPPRLATDTASPEAASPEPLARAPEAEDLPLFAPRPAGTPLAVRRPGHDVPKPRRTTTRPLRVETPALPLAPEAPEAQRQADTDQPRTPRAPVAEVAGLGGRLAAALIDLGLLVAIDAGVYWLTLRIAGLGPTIEDARLIHPIPMAGFFFVLAFLYLAGFTVGGGQTIGKMALGIRVSGDDGRGVDITGAVVRALGCIAAVATLGLLFVPAFFGAERRAVHDRLAGTRVVVG